VAGAIFLHSGDTATFKFGASDEAFQQLRPNNLVMWEAIKVYRGEGRHLLDFGRTSLENAGLRKFKLSWGTIEQPIEYHRYHVRTESFMTAKDRSSGWHSRVFKSLPIGMSRLLGAMFYNHAA
jgi:lipid II:glycine glycyltransferase (peptidoglycan interpeptide bridge formation enzyme)